jgi:hypothetical protein
VKHDPSTKAMLAYSRRVLQAGLRFNDSLHPERLVFQWCLLCFAENMKHAGIHDMISFK